MGFGFWVLGLRVLRFGFGILSVGFGVLGLWVLGLSVLGLWVLGLWVLDLWVLGLCFWIIGGLESLGFASLVSRLWALGHWVQGLRCRIDCLEFRVSNLRSMFQGLGFRL